MQLTTADKKRLQRLERKTKKRLADWKRKPLSRRKGLCWFREWVKEKYGERGCCSHPDREYDECAQTCGWIPHCRYCGSDLIKFINNEVQDTNGVVWSQWVAVCANPKCPLNEPKEAGDYYV